MSGPVSTRTGSISILAKSLHVLWVSAQKVPPGQTVVYREVYVYDLFKPGRAFVLFCNEPGHYEQGEYAGLVVK
jgi:hypothetical protein